MSEGIRLDDWLKELSRLEATNPEGFTTDEMADATGISYTVMLKRLKKAVDAKLIEFVGFRTGTRVDGRTKQTPVYRTVKRD